MLSEHSRRQNWKFTEAPGWMLGSTVLQWNFQVSFFVPAYVPAGPRKPSVGGCLLHVVGNWVRSDAMAIDH